MLQQRFLKQSVIAASPAEVFAWHEQPGAVECLTPPWEHVELIERGAGLSVGTRVSFKVYFGPFAKIWLAEHIEYDPPRLFADVQRTGPFAHWYHRHRFEPTTEGQTLMTDDVEYALPMGWLGQLFGGALVRAKLRKMFDYRHQVVRERFAK